MSEWQPIETAPKDGSEFQAWVRRSNWPEIAWWEPKARWRGDNYAVPELWGRVDYDEEGWDLLGPGMEMTNWMPLPTPPLEDS